MLAPDVDWDIRTGRRHCGLRPCNIPTAVCPRALSSFLRLSHDLRELRYRTVCLALDHIDALRCRLAVEPGSLGLEQVLGNLALVSGRHAYRSAERNRIVSAGLGNWFLYILYPFKEVVVVFVENLPESLLRSILISRGHFCGYPHFYPPTRYSYAAAPPADPSGVRADDGS